MCDVEDHEPVSELPMTIGDARGEGIAERAAVHNRSGDAVVPPDCHGIPFDELQKAMRDRLIERERHGAAVRVIDTIVCVRLRVEAVMTPGC